MNRNRPAAAKTLLITAVLLLALLGAGCAGSPTETALEKGFPITVTDDIGCEVTVTASPARIISLAPSNTEMLFALGLGPKIVGVTDFCNYPAEAPAKERVGGFVNPSLEKIIALEPDLVVAADLHRELVPQLNNLKIPVVVLNARSVDGMLNNIILVGRLTGLEMEAERLTGELRARVEAVTGRVSKIAPSKRPRVYYEVWHEPLCTAGPGTFIDDLIGLAGGTNVAADAPVPWPQYSAEVIVRKNPEVMLHAYGHGDAGSQTPAGIARRPGWSSVSFVKSGRVYAMDADMMNRAGPRLVDALEAVARALHPEVFERQE
ncbi:MAG: cobalamin-binding protein [Bacillota bacterium]|jgi:iron complex transport system substrate-binding protein